MAMGAMIVILWIIFSPVTVYRDFRVQNEFVIWNVGQGQWATLISQNECLHFDIGGEFDVSRRVEKLCSGKINKIFLSHWDWDHVGLIGHFGRHVDLNLCLAQAPLGESSHRKMSLVTNLPPCTPTPQILKVFEPEMLSSFKQRKTRRPNNHISQVFWIAGYGILIPGDSTSTEEKLWAPRLPKTPLGIILGHHGSNTSTSAHLLKHIKNIRWAVSSARKKRYGHPHPKVVARLKIEKIPLLRTEDWGSLHFEF